MVAFFFFRATHVLVLRCTSSSFFCLFVLKNSLSVCVVFCLKNFIFFSLICPQICPLKKRATSLAARKEEKPSFSPHCCCFSVLCFVQRRRTKNYEELRRRRRRHTKERTKRENFCFYGFESGGIREEFIIARQF